MNKQTLLHASIRLIAVFSFLSMLQGEVFIFHDIISRIGVYKNISNTMIFYHYGLLVIAVSIVLVFAINPELMWFKFKDADKKQSKLLFEIGMLILGVFFTIGAIQSVLKGGRFSFDMFALFIFAVYLFIVIRAKIVLPKVLKT